MYIEYEKELISRLLANKVVVVVVLVSVSFTFGFEVLVDVVELDSPISSFTILFFDIGNLERPAASPILLSVDVEFTY